MTHEIKSHPEAFQHRWDGIKPWEFRNNDRHFGVRDFLHEREWNQETSRYTGRSILSSIVLIYSGRSAIARKFGIPRSFCVMTVETVARGARP